MKFDDLLKSIENEMRRPKIHRITFLDNNEVLEFKNQDELNKVLKKNKKYQNREMKYEQI